MSLLEQLKWRYATKNFDKTKKISDKDVNMLVDNVLLSPSSYGLQPYRLIVIGNSSTKEQLFPHSFNQNQVLDCSHIFLFCIENNVSKEYADSYVNQMAKIRNIDRSSLDMFRNSLNNVCNMDENQYKIWSFKQTYIALGVFLTACAINNIDACPMEGFLPKKYDEVLNLKEKNIQSVVMATAGYRVGMDETKYSPKVRKPIDDFLIKF